MSPPPKLTRNQVKHLSALRSKKHRYEQRQFVVEGETMTAEIVSAATSELRYLVCTQTFLEQQSPTWQSEVGGRIYCCDEPTIASISSLDSPCSVLALLDMPLEDDASQVGPPSAPAVGLSLYLDGLRDPGNLGTIWRIADWFGVSQLFLSDDCVDLYNPKTIQASMGAFLRVAGRSRSLASLRAEQPLLTILGTRMDGGENGLNCSWSTDTLLVIGSESQGVRPEIHEHLNGWLSIPRASQSSGAESLNAAVATGILCSSYLRSFP